MCTVSFVVMNFVLLLVTVTIVVQARGWTTGVLCGEGKPIQVNKVGFLIHLESLTPTLSRHHVLLLEACIQT